MFVLSGPCPRSYQDPSLGFKQNCPCRGRAIAIVAVLGFAGAPIVASATSL